MFLLYLFSFSVLRTISVSFGQCSYNVSVMLSGILSVRDDDFPNIETCANLPKPRKSDKMADGIHCLVTRIIFISE